MESADFKKTEKSQFESNSNLNNVYPSLEDLAAGFSFVLHVKIIEDLESKASANSPTNETFFNREHLMSYLNSDEKDVPSANQIYTWIFSLYHSANLSEECLMLALIYILRVLKIWEIKIFSGNWQIIIIAATLNSLRVCELAHNCSPQMDNFFTGLNFDEFFELNDEFSHLIESKYEVDISSFKKCFDILAFAWQEEPRKKRKLNLEKINKIVKKSKTFDEFEDDCEQRIIKSERIYNIDLNQYEFDN